jgi:hypothetical protein
VAVLKEWVGTVGAVGIDGGDDNEHRSRSTTLGVDAGHDSRYGCEL